MIDERDTAIKRIEEKHSLYKRVFESEDGVEVLQDLERLCYTTTTTFSSDALEMSYREGMRCVALHVKTLIELDVEKMNDSIQQSEQE